MKAEPETESAIDAEAGGDEPAWRTRAVSRSVDAARSRAEQRAQRYLDAAFELIDEKGTTEFTIQEVVDRSKQSLRGFYEYFEGKDELVLALLEETAREAGEDLRTTVETESEPLERLAAFALRLHEWCDPAEQPRKRGAHNRRAISEFSMSLAADHAKRVQTAVEPLSHLGLELVSDAAAAGVITVDDPRRATQLLLQTVMHTWIGNRLVDNPKLRLTAEETWEFCRRGLGG